MKRWFRGWLGVVLALSLVGVVEAQFRRSPITRGIDLSNMLITGGAVDGTPVGATTPSTGAFTTLTASGDTTLSNPLLFGDDNADDIGATGATRPRTGYFATSLRVQSDTGEISLGASDDVKLVWEAANTLGLRNSTNEQGFHVFNTWTSATDQERLELSWSGNRASVVTRKGSAGGVDRELQIGTMDNDALSFITNAVQRWNVQGAGHFVSEADNLYDFGAVGALRPRRFYLAEYVEMSEMTAPSAPGANNGRLYLDVSGAKTRLMIIFQSGAAQQVAIEP